MKKCFECKLRKEYNKNIFAQSDNFCNCGRRIEKRFAEIKFFGVKN